MTTPTESPQSALTPRHLGRRGTAIAAALALTLTTGAVILSDPASAASHPSPNATLATAVTSSSGQASTATPAAGAVVRCQGLGDLTAVSGFIHEQAPVTVSRDGRAHVFFTVTTSDVVLQSTAGVKYRLEGVGYDYVVYPSAKVVGKVVVERESFFFDVSHASHIVGTVRLTVTTGPDQKPHVQDNSTCQLPNL